MTYRSREDILDSNCQFLPPTCSESLFASPSEICHWNSAVWDTSLLTPPDSPQDSDVSSQSAETSLLSRDSLSTYSMEHSTYCTSSSPEAKVEMDPYNTTGWTDRMFLPGNAPFSPVLSDTNQSGFTHPTSEVSFSSLGPSVTQEIPMMDTYPSDTWAAEPVGNHFFVEPTVAEPDMFSFQDQGVDVAQHRYQAAWYTPTEATVETYFPMDCQRQSQSYAPVVPQTAGFVGNPVNLVPQTGYSNSGYHTGHSRTDSLYSQANQQSVLVGLNHIVSDHTAQDVTGSMPPRRITVAVSPNEPVQTRSAGMSEPDLPYGAPVQQYRMYAPEYSSVLPIAGAYGSSDLPIVGSNASVSSAASSIAPAGYEESPRSPASSTTTRTRAEDSDGRARTDPLYSAKSRGDGNYHCPFVVEGCQHRPTKLKCNYDKYIDSHIKPFRCKHSNCNNNRFSSTACLLRHEREAHGLHGHGNKPFLCEFKDCDRSARDNGFPRAYNLLDHMKRVHGYRPEKSAKIPPSQVSVRASGKPQDKIKKRKETHQRSNSTVKKEAVSPMVAQRLGSEDRKRKMMMQWQARMNELQQKLQRVQHPHEAASDLQQVSQELAELQQLSRQFG